MVTLGMEGLLSMCLPFLQFWRIKSHDAIYRQPVPGNLQEEKAFTFEFSHSSISHTSIGDHKPSRCQPQHWLQHVKGTLQTPTRGINTKLATANLSQTNIGLTSMTMYSTKLLNCDSVTRRQLFMVTTLWRPRTKQKRGQQRRSP